MFEARSLTNFIGNRVATIVVARSENELDKTTLAPELSGRSAPIR
jgi:aerobic C4-dicarboxylate transport protein